MKDSAEVGQSIRKLRELRNLTQEYVAIQLDMSQSAYCKVETGATQITLKRLTQIALVLDVQPEDILAFDVDRVFTTTAHNDLITQLRAENAHLKMLVERLMG